jgi:hypothetical protein
MEPMSAHSGITPSDDGIVSIKWREEPGDDPALAFSPWEVRIIEQGWRVIEACLSVDREMLPAAIRTEIATYEDLEEVWYGEMRQSPVWPQGQGRGQATRQE